MLKFTLISLLLWSYLTWVSSSPTDVAEPLVDAEDEQQEEFSTSDFNSTIDDESIIPQPRYAQLNVNNKVYTVYFSKLNWFTALEYCNYHGQALASIRNEEDNAKLIKTLHQYGLHQSEPLWLGANDLGHQGSFVWTSNGQPITYFTNWRFGEPNNDCGNEHCIELLSDGQWNDVRCDEKRRFICENRIPYSSYNAPIYS